MHTGRKILNLRLDMNFTQRDLAKACGITPGALSKIETGTNRASAQVLRKLAKILRTDPAYLLDEAAPYPPWRQETAAGNPPPAHEGSLVEARITKQEFLFLEQLRALGPYWREVAFALPQASIEAMRLIRYMLKRGQERVAAGKAQAGQTPPALGPLIG